MSKRSVTFRIGVGMVLFVLVNTMASFYTGRFDMTRDQRFTLSEPALKAVSALTDEIVVDVLLDGSLPPEFERLKVETRLLLDAFRAANPNIRIHFADPLEGNEAAAITNLQELGLTPVNVQTRNKGSLAEEVVFPWALVNYGQATVKVALLKNRLGASSEERVNNSVQNLEYAFADAFTKLRPRDKKQVAILKGNGELDDIEMADFLSTIRDYYNIAPITLDSVATNPQGVAEQLNRFDLAVIAKPTETFTDEEKYILDQFMVRGGKSIWLLDPVVMELDSLFNQNGSALAVARNLNLDDLLFRYGIRLNPVLVNDLYFTQIVLATGEGNAARYDPAPWYYHPMVFSPNNHPINTNTEALRFQFTGTLDTLSNAYSKTIIYQSSPLSKTEGVPRMISLDLIKTPPDKDTYTQGNQPLAVLVEGAFSSAYTNRIKPFNLPGAKDQGSENKLLVVADGDVIRNQLRNGRPLELGYDKWTNNFYGNKEFLINAVNYMLDDSGLLNLRTRKVEIPVLDTEKVAQELTRWQWINLAMPIGVVFLFGLLLNARRKRKYGN